MWWLFRPNNSSAHYCSLLYSVVQGKRQYMRTSEHATEHVYTVEGYSPYFSLLTEGQLLMSVLAEREIDTIIIIHISFRILGLRKRFFAGGCVSAISVSTEKDTESLAFMPNRAVFLLRV